MIEQYSGLAQRVQIHAALADPGRLTIVDRLLSADASPSELHAAASMSSNLVAHHLHVLEGRRDRPQTRSEADRRRTYLKLNHDALESMVPSRNQPRQPGGIRLHAKLRPQPIGAAIWNRHSSVPATSAGTHPAARSAPRRGGRSPAPRPHDAPRAPRHLDDVLRRGGPGDRGVRQRSRRTACRSGPDPLVDSRPSPLAETGRLRCRVRRTHRTGSTLLHLPATRPDTESEPS